MNVFDLTQKLTQDFNTLLIADLSEISSGPGNLLRMLDPIYKSSYDFNDRIVIYTSHVLTDPLLKHLYDTANFLDISNWFFLICAPAENKSLIETACREYSTDPVPFQFLAVDLDETKPLENSFHLPDTICSIPWHSIEILQNGDITPCCMSKNTLLGNIQTTTITQAFYSETAQNLRQAFLDGKRPEACRACWNVEDKGLTSIRMHNIKRLKKPFLTTTLEDPHITNIDLKFNNTCNFKCRICGDAASSLHAQEQHKFKGIPLVTQSKWSESENFHNQITEVLDRLNNIDMFGGEPFLIKKFNNVLKTAIEKGLSKNIRLHYNSNGSVWPGEFLEYWPHFKLVDIHFSIDAVGRRFEIERGGTWKEVENNILALRDLGLPNLNISLMPSISIMNIYYIDEVYDWARKNNFPIFVSHVRGKGFELVNLPEHVRTLIIEKYQNHPWEEMKKIIKLLSESPPGDINKFIEHTQWFDLVRQENFSESHPEIAKAIGYSYNK